MTDVELDERVTVLEENGSGGSNANGKFKLKILLLSFSPELYLFFSNLLFLLANLGLLFLGSLVLFSF